MRFYLSFTPRHWEIGLSFYKGKVFVNNLTNLISSKPSEFAILLGPFSLCFVFGHEIEIVNR